MKPFQRQGAIAHWPIRVGLGWLTLLLYAVPVFSIPTSPQVTQNFLEMERGLEQDFETYFGEDLATVTQTPDDVAATLAKLSQQTGRRSAVLWVIPRPEELHLVLLLPNGTPIVRDLAEMPRDRFFALVHQAQQEVSDLSLSPKQFQATQELYHWIISPFEADYLQPAAIDSLLFCLGNGGRGLPIAALQDPDRRYLIEKYSVTSIPAFNLIDTRYRPIQSGQILAAGASQFETLSPLPAVPLELEQVQAQLRDTPISQQKWQGRSLLNERFTLKKFKRALKRYPLNIIHLATHAQFEAGKPQDSFIQLHHQALHLDQMHQIQWPDELDLLVLSACQTALGDPQSELGFAGVALKSRIKSAIGSLWFVSDLGTLALMTEFYHALPQSPTKAIALQQAQLKLLQGDIRLAHQQLQTQRGSTSLPNAIAVHSTQDFTHPYFWAGFTLLSSPW